MVRVHAFAVVEQSPVPFAVGALNGLDALLATAQVPGGVPVACVGIDNAKNAAHLAVRILKV